MKNFFEKILAKTPKFDNMAGWHLRPRSFRSPTVINIMVDTHKFTSRGKLWNNFCAGCSIKMPRHLSPDLHSGRVKGQVWGILLTVTNDQFWQSTPAQKELKHRINASIGLFINKFHIWCLRMCVGGFELILQVSSTLWPDIKPQKLSEHRFRLKWTKCSPRTQFKPFKTGQDQRD